MYAGGKSMPNLQPNSIADDHLLKVAEVSKIVKMSRPSIYRQIKGDTFPSVKVGKSRRFRNSDIQAWIAGLETSVPVPPSWIPKTVIKFSGTLRKGFAEDAAEAFYAAMERSNLKCC
jgi:excisionase family DNA binding protein